MRASKLLTLSLSAAALALPQSHESSETESKTHTGKPKHRPDRRLGTDHHFSVTTVTSIIDRHNVPAGSSAPVKRDEDVICTYPKPTESVHYVTRRDEDVICTYPKPTESASVAAARRSPSGQGTHPDAYLTEWPLDWIPHYTKRATEDVDLSDDIPAYLFLRSSPGSSACALSHGECTLFQDRCIELNGVCGDHDDYCWMALGACYHSPHFDQHDRRDEKATAPPPEHTTCQPLDPICSGSSSKRDNPHDHISADTGNRLYRWGRMACDRKFGENWLTCMDNFINDMNDFYQGVLERMTDDHDKKLPGTNNIEFALQWYRWAEQQCKLREGADDWDDCMGQFRQNSYDDFQARLDQHRGDDADKDKRDANEVIYQQLGEQLYLISEWLCTSRQGDDHYACMTEVRDHWDEYIEGRVKATKNSLHSTSKRDYIDDDTKQALVDKIEQMLEPLCEDVKTACETYESDQFDQCWNDSWDVFKEATDNASELLARRNNHDSPATVKRDDGLPSELSNDAQDTAAPTHDRVWQTLRELTKTYCEAFQPDQWQQCYDVQWPAVKSAVEGHIDELTKSKVKRDDWTHWACSRGVQWACSYPDFDESGAAQPPINKRDDDDLPSDVGETITIHSSAQGQEYTAILVLQQTSPLIYRDTFLASGSSYNVIISQMYDEPTSAAQTVIWGGSTNVHWTATDETASIGRLTSVDFGAYVTPPTVIRTAASTLAGAQKVRRDVNKVQTLTILDEQPGHTTLNHGQAGKKNAKTTHVTVVDIDGKKHKLTPTVDADGNQLLATEGFVVERVKETATATVMYHEDGIFTIHPTRSGNNMVTATIHMTEAADYTVNGGAPKDASTASKGSTVIAPIPKVKLPPTATVYKTITKIKHADPSGAIIMPMDYDPSKVLAWQDIMGMPLKELKRRHPHAGWDNVIPRIARQLRRDQPDMDHDTSLKRAFIMVHDASPKGVYPPINDGENQVTQYGVDLEKTVMTFPGSTVPLTAPTQVIGTTTFIRDPLVNFRQYDPLVNPQAPTGSCHNIDDDDAKNDHWPEEHHTYNKTACKLERCMWDYMKPMKVSTVTKGYMMATDHPQYGYFTYETHLHRPHWGIKHTTGVYYPAHVTQALVNHTQTVNKLVVETPHWWSKDDMVKQGVHDRRSSCYDVDTCYAQCIVEDNDKNFFERYWHWMLVGLLALMAMMLACCCIPRARRRLNDRKNKRKPSEKPQEVVVNQTTGQVTDPAGNPVDRQNAAETAVVAGSAAGAESARGNDPNSTDDGRGTTGRRAEEGRGRVNFEDGGKPGQEAPHTETTEKPAGHPAESKQEAKEVKHGEPQPVPDKDGAGSATGHDGPDTGSVRGRKRNRPEGGLARLGF